MKEILTIQVGSFANIIGSHFWNFQDELLGLVDDPDSDQVFKNYHQYLSMEAFYRNGETQQGILTCIPRLVSIDSQDCHKSGYIEHSCSELHSSCFPTGSCRASVSEARDAINEAYKQSSNKTKVLPFLSISENLVGQHDELLSSRIPGSSPRGSLDVHFIPMAARLRSSNAILPFLENRLLNLGKYGIERRAPGTELLQSWSSAKDESELRRH